MTKKLTICLLCFFYSITNIIAQTGDIYGTVKTSDGKPAEFVNVVLVGTNKGTSADKNGRYEIKNIAAGSYTLRSTYVGLETKEISVTVVAGQTISVPEIALNENAEQLSEIIISSAKGLKPSSQTLSKMPVKYMEDVQSYSIITKETIREIGATDFQTALRAVPGASGASSDGYGYTNLYLRGFQAQPNYRNGIYNYSHSGGDPQNLEQIEVLRGPAATLFGAAGGGYPSQYGGIVNKVTKTAFDGKLFEGGLALGSYSLTRAFADMNTVLSKENNVYFRLNAVYQINPVWQQTRAQSKDMLIAPVLVYKPSEKLQLKIEAELNANDFPSMFYFTADNLDLSTTKSIKDLPLKYNRYYSDYNFVHQDPVVQNNFLAQVQYQFHNGWKLTFDAHKNLTNHTNGAIFPYWYSDTLMARDWYDFDYRWEVTNTQLNLNGTFAIGKIKNTVLAGVSYLDFILNGAGKYSYAAIGHLDTVNLAQDIVPVVDVPSVRSKANFESFRFGNHNSSLGIYVADKIDLTDKLHLLLSLRFDKFKYYDSDETPSDDGYNQGAVSPKLGVVYEVLKEKVSLFANYSTAFNNVAPTPFQTFDPEFSRQYEGGVKFAIGNKFGSTFSYYDIEISNAVRQNPDNNQLKLQDGTRQSKGFDFELTATPVTGWKIITGYGYNDSKFIQSDASVLGKRPAAVAQHAANLWTTYTVQNSRLKGAGAGFGFNYFGENYFNDLNSLIIPAYTVLNASVFYNADKWRAGLNINNLTDKKYWNSAGLPQKPFNFLASLSIKI